MKKQKFVIIGNVVGQERGSIIDLTEEQAKSRIWAGRVRPATVVSVVDPEKEQELVKHSQDLQAQLAEAEAKAVELQKKLDEANARADKAEADLKDRDKAQLEIATAAAASSKK